MSGSGGSYGPNAGLKTRALGWAADTADRQKSAHGVSETQKLCYHTMAMSGLG